jgi:hypothetical protein
MSWQVETVKWVGLFALSKIIPPIWNRGTRRFVKASTDFVNWQTLNEYQTVLWLHRKPEQFYRYAFESIAGFLKMVAMAGGIAGAGFLFYDIATTAAAKSEIVQWAAGSVMLVFSFMMTRCRGVELIARRLREFDRFRAAVSPDLVKQAEEDPRLR